MIRIVELFILLCIVVLGIEIFFFSKPEIKMQEKSKIEIKEHNTFYPEEHYLVNIDKINYLEKVNQAIFAGNFPPQEEVIMEEEINTIFVSQETVNQNTQVKSKNIPDFTNKAELQKEAARVAKIHLSLKNKIRERECGKNDALCKNKNGNYKVYRDGKRLAVGIASNNYCIKNDCTKIKELPAYIVEIQFHNDVEEKIKIAKKKIWYWGYLTQEAQDEIIDFYYQVKGGFHATGMHFHLEQFYSGKDIMGRHKAKQIWLTYTKHVNSKGEVVHLQGLAKRSQEQVNNFFSEKSKSFAMQQYKNITAKTNTSVAKNNNKKTLNHALEELNI